jgi:hypothetical protein
MDQRRVTHGQKSKKIFNDLSKGNFIQKIYCAHSQSVKTFVLPLNMEKYVFLPIFSHLLTLNLIFFEFVADFFKISKKFEKRV